MGRRSAMRSPAITRRVLLRRAGALAAATPFAPALIGRARAATVTMRLSTSQANDPKYANGRVYYAELMKQLQPMMLAEQIAVQPFPHNRLVHQVAHCN